jgi:hypothetical protein
VAGGRRWRAPQLLIKQKHIVPNYAVPCLVVSHERAMQISRAENSAQVAVPLAKLKKAAITTAAEQQIVGTGWLPSILRTAKATPLARARKSPRLVYVVAKHAVSTFMPDGNLPDWKDRGGRDCL